MEVTKIIPQESVQFTVHLIEIRVKTKQAIVHIESSQGRNSILISLPDIIAEATDAQKTVINGFFKGVIAAALAVAAENINDVI